MAARVPRRRRTSAAIFAEDENVRVITDAIPSQMPAVELYEHGFDQYLVVSFKVRRLFDRRVEERPCVIKPNERRRVWEALGGDPRNLKSTRLNKKMNSPYWILSFHLRQPVFVETISTRPFVHVHIHYNTHPMQVINWMELRMLQTASHLERRTGRIVPNWS